MASDSQVTIRLDLVGQKVAVAGLTEVSDAVKELASSVAASDEEVATSTEAMAADVTAANATVADSTRDTAAAARESAEQIVAANDETSVSAEDTAERTAAAADSVSLSYARMAKSAAMAMTGRAGVVESSGSASGGLMGAASSMYALAGAAVVYESVKAFTSYTTALTKLGSQAGLTATQVAQVGAAITKMPVSLGQSRTSLASAFYNPISEGFSVGQSTNVVTQAAKLADLSGAPLTGQDGTSYALSTLLRSYGEKATAKNTQQMAALINAGVGSGDMTMSQLLAASGTGYFNATRSYGISKQSAVSNLDFFSSQGVSPQSAATRMRMTMALMAAPSATADKYYTSLGLSDAPVSGVQGQLAALGLSTTKMAGLLRSPDGINAAVSAVLSATKSLSPEMKEALYSKLFGGGRSEATFLSLANDPKLAQTMYTRVGANDTTSKLNSDYGQWQKTPAAQWAAFRTAIEDLGVTVGQVVTPLLMQLVHNITPGLAFLARNEPAIKAFFGGLEEEISGPIRGFAWVVRELVSPVTHAVHAFEDMYHAIDHVANVVDRFVSNLGHVGGNVIHDITHPFGLASGGRVGAGFMTNGPTAIVGEGRPQFPEFVIPTDPQYRSRATGLLGAAASRMMASGGAIGGNAEGIAGSGAGMISVLSQLVGGRPGGAVNSILHSLTGTAGASLPGAEKAVEGAIQAAVPGGEFRQLMQAMVGTVFNSAISGVSASGSTHYAMGGTLPLQVLDQGGWLPEGPSISINNLGRPERVPGPSEDAGGTYIFQSVLDGKVISETVYKGLRGKLARQ